VFASSITFNLASILISIRACMEASVAKANRGVGVLALGVLPFLPLLLAMEQNREPRPVEAAAFRKVKS
jgi:hypothetical protein